MESAKIPLESIRLQDERFRVSRFFDLEKLKTSIRKIGLVNPPVITHRDGHRVLVSGWKRVLACLELGLSPIPVFIYRDEDDRDAFLFFLHENLAFRDFNLVEKAEILHKLHAWVPSKQEMIRRFLPLLGIPGSREYLEVHLEIAALEPHWKKKIQAARMSISNVRLFLAFEPDDRKVVGSWLFLLNRNKQKEVMENLLDLGRKRGESPRRILAAPWIRSIMENEKLPPSRRADEILRQLRKERFPLLFSWKRAFSEALRKAGLEEETFTDDVALFEEGKFWCSFSLLDRNGFEEKLRKLKILMDDSGLLSIFQKGDDGR